MQEGGHLSRGPRKQWRKVGRLWRTGRSSFCWLTDRFDWDVARKMGPGGVPASSGPGRSSRQIGAAPVGPCHFCGEFGHLKYA